MSQRLRVLREFGLQLQVLEHATPVRGTRAAARRRSAVVAAVLFVLALATGALAASGVFGTGAPVEPSAKDLVTPRSGNGAAITSSVGPIVATAADPAGGPAWGIRALKTTRGLGCLQLGRVVNGRLGVLGEDGAFANDRRFHPLPPQVNESPVDCDVLDAHGQLFLAFESQGVPASADPVDCTNPTIVQPHPKPATCPTADQRAIYAGLLGPSAISVTYALPGEAAHTIHVGPDGAYLIVTRPDPKIHGGANFSGLLPPSGNGNPIESITYRNGQHCLVGSGKVTTTAGGACAPVGYVAPRAVTPSPQLLAAPIHHALRIDTLVAGHPADELLVSFTSKVAVQSATSAYALQLQLPHSGTCHGDQAGTMTNGNIAAGQTTQLDLAYAHPAGLLHCPGVYSATVYYLHSTTTTAAGGIAAPLEAPTPGSTEPPGITATVVGHFTFRVK